MTKRTRLKVEVFRIVHSGGVCYARKIGQNDFQSYISVYNLATQLKKKEPNYEKGEIIFKGLTPAQERQFWSIFKN